MAGELEINDVTFDNAGLVNFGTNLAVDIDPATSDSVITSIKLPTAQGELIGVTYDKAKLTPAGAVPAGEGMAVRVWGIARVKVSAAVAVGAYVSSSGTDGRVAAKVKSIAGAQPTPVLGRAITSAAAANENILVVLMPGAQY